MRPISDFAGRLLLQPGAPGSAIVGGRPELASRLARGRPAQSLPALMASLFTLCSHAHRLTAGLALDAALGRPLQTSAAQRESLQRATAREQLLRIAHDWPRLQPIDGLAAGQALQGCPLWRHDLAASQQWAALPGWLAQRWLGETPAAWLHAWAEAPDTAARRWTRRCDSAVARWLRAVQPRAAALATAVQPLTLPADPAPQLRDLATRMADDGFCQRPAWAHGVPDTGPWTRHHAPPAQEADNAWMRLVSRLVDLLHLAAPEGVQWLTMGAAPMGDGTGVAWTEMARGLLVYRVQVCADDTAEGSARIADCRVLAPTEWNFHPQGVLARALGGLQGAQAVQDARLLALAFDPCMPFDVVSPAPAREPAHA